MITLYTKNSSKLPDEFKARQSLREEIARWLIENAPDIWFAYAKSNKPDMSLLMDSLSALLSRHGVVQLAENAVLHQNE